MSHFAVVDTIKSDVAFTPGQHLVAYRVGGEVENAGEKVRIDTPDMAAFEPAKSYILLLRHDKNASVEQYLSFKQFDDNNSDQTQCRNP